MKGLPSAETAAYSDICENFGSAWKIRNGKGFRNLPSQ